MVKNMREELNKKLRSYERVIQSITETAQSVIPPDTKMRLLTIHKATAELRDRVENNYFEIAIVGLEKAGKSTFANALIGSGILPTKEERCTYTSSCVKYAAKTYAEVEFFTVEEFSARFESSLRSLGIEFESYEFGKVSLKELQTQTSDLMLSPEKRNILEDLTDMIKSEVEIMFWLGKPLRQFSKDEMDQPEFKNLIQNPDRENGKEVSKPTFAVKRITVYSDQLEDMKNCIIYDVPGFDSPTAIHMEQTKKRMDSADAVVLIANASKPSLTGPQINIFRSGVDSDGVPFNEKTFVFANRADESRSLQYNLKVLMADLHKYSILRSTNSDRLVAGSAYAYLCRLKGAQDAAAQQALANLASNGITEGIEEIKQKLERYNSIVRLKVIEKRVNHLENDLRQIIEEIKGACGNISLTDGSNAELLNAFEDVKNKFQEKLVFYRSKIRSILTEKPLTSSILSVLKTELRADALYPTESEIEKLKKESIQGVVQFESKLREKKRREIKEQFDSITLGLSEDMKREAVDEVIRMLLESLNVSAEHLYFEEIKEMVKSYIEKYFNDFNFMAIHKALTLRFAGEVFEILLNKPFLMPDRMEYFENNIENLVSLALYEQDFRDAFRNQNSIEATNLPMINSILFHDGANAENTGSDVNQEDEKETAVRAIEEAIKPKLLHECKELSSLAEKTVRWCISQDVSINMFIQTLNRVMPDLKMQEFTKDKECEAIKYYLNKTIDQISAKSPVPNTETLSLNDRYLEAVKKRENTHDWVVKSFKDDICILIRIISGSVVNAIQLEVPFVENLTNIVEKIQDDLQHKSTQFTPFIDFFGRVYPKSEYQKVEENETIQQNNQEKQEILNHVDSLLQELG